ncbi:PVC-type heme-binding CxxCH protein [Thalassoglobus sp.]|uniref:PVC-type heme-binding CxxCH protein n=1 Tax=Thalassoglobus sp. TaxID=2795869 RepID=UPI003AA85543
MLVARFSLRFAQILFTGLITLSVGSVLQAQNFGEMIRSSDPLTPEEELKTFTVPEGFEVQLFAAEPDIQKPMNMAFDSRGRLWVSGSNDYPFPNFTESATDSIRILEDTNGDGRADKFTTFVEGITVPIGLYPYQDGVIAFSIPNITFYRDTDGDGKSDEAKVLYGPFDYSRDTHGLNNGFRRGLDGWMYACHGFNNNSKVAGADGHAITMQSGNTYRFKLDGSRIEHFTHGQVNPFGMTFDHLGDAYTSDCHTKPVTLLIQDGYYPSFGKPHDGLGFVPPVMEHLHGSTAIAGISQYTGGGFPEEYENNLFVGNVMTSRVHRDVIQYTGSTVKVVEQPDFLSSSDSWFRPVETQCGPDQALYVADFYNRIIGHYEVPLDHPGRDRHRARIWRVSYVGDQPVDRLQPPQDLTKLSARELISQLTVPNLPYDYRIVEQLVDRLGEDCLPEVRSALEDPKTPLQHAYLLWVRHRLDDLSIVDLQTAFGSKDEVVRIHVQRILADLSDWSEGHVQLACDGLQNSPLVRRAAATALAQHSRISHIPVLVAAHQTASEHDVHQRHVCKIGLRNAMQLDGAYEFIEKLDWSEADTDLLAQVSLAVKSEASATYLLQLVDRVEFSNADLRQIVTLAARHLQEQDISQVVSLSKSRFASDLDQQLELLLAIQSGLRQQGRMPTKELSNWGVDLVQQVFEADDSGRGDWKSLGLPKKRPIDWGLELRNTVDGKKDVPFLSSLPAGERAVGLLRSKSFILPAELSFDLCGHLGFPNQAAIPQNFVSLHLAKNHQEIQKALAPRNDTAQRVTWDLGEHAGEKGYLQVTDNVSVRAYAWIAISGISPPVVQIPKVDLKTSHQRLISSANICRQLGLTQFEADLKSIALNPSLVAAVRFAALESLVTKQSSPDADGLLSIYNSSEVTGQQKIRIAQVILNDINQNGKADADAGELEFLALLKTFPLTVQTALARSMSLQEAGATRLAELIENGAISPSVLASAVVNAQLEALDDKDLRQKFTSLKATLPEADDKILNLIEQRRSEFKMELVSLDVGKAIFKKNCAACHSVGEEGKKVGPQLDGIGNRGLDRVLEDVLAPNRNIDLAFRSRIYLLESGKVYSGLFRREEGELTVIADTKGEEISFSTKEIAAEKVSNLSIMPENWGELIKDDEFQHLLGYLMSQRQK